MNTEESFIKIFRLHNGEDIISLCEQHFSEETMYYRLYNPMKIVYYTTETPIHPTTLSVSLFPWFLPQLTDDTDYDLRMKDFITIAHPTAKMIDHYTNMLLLIETMKNGPPEEEKSPQILEESSGEGNTPPTDNISSTKSTTKQVLH